MKKIGIIGDKESVLCFMTAGFTVFVTEDKDEAASIIKHAEKDGFAILFITEALIEQLPEVFDAHKASPGLAIIPLPRDGGNTGFGMAQIKSAVERAVGADILK